MKIIIKNNEEIKKIKAAGKLAAKVLVYIEPFVKAGTSTEKLNQLCHEYIVKNKAIPAPLNYKGFPKSICTSVNHVVCHGIPSKKQILKNGDIVNIDITVIKEGYHGDCSKTFCVGTVDPAVQILVNRTEKAMYKGIDVIKPGVLLNEIGRAIQKYVSKFNYGLVRNYTGHGIGKNFHEDPIVLHYYSKTFSGPRLKSGMVFTVEPMVNLSSKYETYLDEKDKWTVYTKDGALSAQFEHTVAVTDDGYEILTRV